MSTFDRDIRWLEHICLAFVTLGVLLPFAYLSPVFALYRGAVAVAIGSDSLAAEGNTLRLLLGITGGSIAGKWLLHWAVIHVGLKHRMKWARDATLAGLVAWFAIDSASSLLCGAWANVVMVNPLPPLLVLPLLLRVAPLCTETTSAAPVRNALQRVVFATLLCGAMSGLVIAFGMDSPLFATWRVALGEAHFGGALPDSAARLARFFAGPIGGATLGHFVLALYVDRHAMRAQQRWAWRWTLGSILLWAAVDSTYSVLAAGAFNVVQVNLPFLALTLPPLALLGIRTERAAKDTSGS